MARITLEAEAAFLLLVARRVLNYKRAAAKDGEVYKDLSRPSPLKCGIKAKMSFEETAAGYQPILYIQAESDGAVVDMPTALQAASELLGAPVKYRGTVAGLHEFERAP